MVREYSQTQFLILLLPIPMILRKNLNSLKKKNIKKATKTRVILNLLAYI